MGTVIAARFEIEARAGSGAMGSVFRALDRTTGQPVAIKMLRRPDREALRRFEREAVVLAGLRHPAIVSYVHYGISEEGHPYLAMDWLDGQDLRSRLRRGPLAEEDTLVLAERILGGLAAAHAAEIVHRDLKPANIFLVEGALAGATVLDFGLARAVDATSSISHTGAIIGSPAYMAPEQACGEEVNASTDLFSLGSVLYECATGRLAFSGDQPVAVLARILFDEPDLADLPARLAAFLEVLLAKAPGDRPVDGADALSRLRAIQRQARRRQPVASRSLSLVENQVAAVVLVGGETVSPLDDTQVDTETTEPRWPTLDRIAGGLSARIEVLFDGKVAAVLTQAPSATDLGDRAARLALELHRAMPGRSIAVATGHAVLHGRIPLGPVIERASRLLRLPAAPDGLLIRLDDTTRSFLDARFDVAISGDSAWLRSIRMEDDPTRRVLGRPAPFVGREREMRMLDATLDAAISGPEAQLMVVSSPPGLGKSRLVREWIRGCEARGVSFALWIARGDPMTTGSPYAMLLHALRRYAGIGRDDLPAARRDRLTSRLTQQLGPADARRVAVFLGELVGAEFSDSNDLPLGAARRDSRLMSDQLQRAWADLLAAECCAQPLILVLEDLQWADAPTVALVDLLARNLATQSLIVVALARPEVTSRFPDLWTGRPMTRLELSTISSKASQELLRAILGAAADEESIGRLSGKAAGNPFFVEELARAALEGNASTPETVLLMLQARFVGLSASSRRVLRAAAILGEPITSDAVAALLDSDERHHVSENLEDLTRRDWLTRTREAEFLFRHTLVREAAYGLSTDTDHRLGHCRAGEWLETRGEVDALVVAEHFEAAGEPVRARSWYQRAAQRALGASDVAAALEYSDRAIALGASGIELGRLNLLAAEVHNWRGDYLAAEECSRRACELLPVDDATWGAAANQLQWALAARGKGDQVRLVGRRILQVSARGWTANHLAAAAWIAQRLADGGSVGEADAILEEAGRRGGDTAPALGALHSAHATLAYERDDLQGTIEHYRAAVQAFIANGDRRLASMTEVNLAFSLIEIGDLVGATSLMSSASAPIDGDGSPLSNLFAFVAGWLLALDGAPEGLWRAQAAVPAITDPLTLCLLHLVLARLLCSDGQHEKALASSLRAAEQRQARLEPVALASQARCLLHLGQPADALGLARTAVADARSARTRFGDTLVALVHAEALEAAGQGEAARVALAATRAVVLERADRIRDPSLRAGFLANVPENARVLGLARQWFGDPVIRPA